MTQDVGKFKAELQSVLNDLNHCGECRLGRLLRLRKSLCRAIYYAEKNLKEKKK